MSGPDNIDIVGERKDGGVDLVVVTSAPLDESDTTCQHLELKLGAYLLAAVHPNFPKVYPSAKGGLTRIYVSDRHGVSVRARQVIEAFTKQALAHNVTVQIGNPVA